MFAKSEKGSFRDFFPFYFYLTKVVERTVGYFKECEWKQKWSFAADNGNRRGESLPLICYSTAINPSRRETIDKCREKERVEEYSRKEKSSLINLSLEEEPHNDPGKERPPSRVIEWVPHQYGDLSLPQHSTFPITPNPNILIYLVIAFWAVLNQLTKIETSQVRTLLLSI
jgi:hypothetical protein